jgi:hypothetical protein
MREGITARPERRHGDHHHTLEMFGVTPEDIENAFGEYTAKYQLDRAGSMA